MNYKDGIIRNGSGVGLCSAIGNVKDGIIRAGTGLGLGTTIGNVKDGIVRNGSGLGLGSIKGKVSNFSIKGMEREKDDEIVAAYHFLVKKFL